MTLIDEKSYWRVNPSFTLLNRSEHLSEFIPYVTSALTMLSFSRNATFADLGFFLFYVEKLGRSERKKKRERERKKERR